MRHLPLVGRRWQDAFTAYGILAPSLLLLTLFVYYPALNTLWQSFQFRNLRLPNRRGFSGLDNYLRLLRGTELWASLERSLLVVAYTLPLLLILGLLAALILHAPFPGRGVVRTIAILPWMLPPLVNGFMWSWVLNGDYGALNGLLYQLGLIREYQHWMGVPALQLMWVSLAHVWTRYPFPMLVILAALQSIPEELYDAAKIDGASGPARFWYITFPLLLPAFTVALVVELIAALQIFDIIWSLTGGGQAGGTINPFTKTLMIYNYQLVFRNLNLGQGSAMAYLILLLSSGLGFLFVKSLYRRGGTV